MSGKRRRKTKTEWYRRLPGVHAGRSRKLEQFGRYCNEAGRFSDNRAETKVGPVNNLITYQSRADP